MEPPGELIGAWRLTAYDDRGSVDRGLDRDVRSDRSDCGVRRIRQSLGADLQADGSRFDAYFGRFAIAEVVEEKGDLVGVVNHNVVAGSMPELLTPTPDGPFGSVAKRLRWAMG